MKIKLAALGALLLVGVLATGCCGPCLAIGRLGTRELRGREQAAPTVDARPVWFDLWAEGTTLRRSQGEAAVGYRLLTWCIYEGDTSWLQRLAEEETAFDMGWMQPGTYTAWLKAWYDGSYHQVSDKIMVEIKR